MIFGSGAPESAQKIREGALSPHVSRLVAGDQFTRPEVSSEKVRYP